MTDNISIESVERKKCLKKPGYSIYLTSFSIKTEEGHKTLPYMRPALYYELDVC